MSFVSELPLDSVNAKSLALTISTLQLWDQANLNITIQKVVLKIIKN